MSEGRYVSPEAMVEDLEPSYPVYCVRPARLKQAAETFLERFPGPQLLEWYRRWANATGGG